MHSFSIDQIHNDDEAFVELIKSYRLDLYKTALAFLKNQNEAIEAIQEVTFRAYKKRKQLRNAEFLKTWLIRIMINYCQDTLKKRNRFSRFTGHEKDSTTLNDYNYIWLEEAIHKLSRHEQELIYLKYFHEMTYKELSDQFNQPEGTIKTKIHRALNQLRTELGNQEGGELHERLY